MDRKFIFKKLKEYSKKTIEKSELKCLFGISSDKDLHSFLQENEDIFSRVLRSGTNGNLKYPVYMKYKISLPEEPEEDVSPEIQKLHPILQENGWLIRHPEAYRKYSSLIENLNSWLFLKKQDEEAISRKERSFILFGEEKMLDDSGVRGLLKNLGLDHKAMAYYDTPEYCLNDFIPEKKADMTLLICENKDIWFDIRRLMFEDRRDTFFGVKINGVILGNGGRITEKNCLKVYTDFLMAENVSYFYWGDIDREGLNIFLRLKEKNPGLSVRLFLPGYVKMLTLSRGMELPNSEDRRERCGDYSEIYALFDEETAELMRGYIGQNKRLPQEIISCSVLKNSR